MKPDQRQFVRTRCPALRRRASLLIGVAVVVVTVALGIAVGTVLVLDRPERAGPLVAQSPSATPSVPSSPQPTAGMPETRDEALLRQLADNTYVRLELLGIGPGGFAAPRGQVLCGLHLMGSSDGGSTLYVWLMCGDFTTADGTAELASAGSDPAVVDVSGQGAAVRLRSITFPRQAYRDADIERLFPPSIASHIYDAANTRTSPSPAQLKEAAAARAGLPRAPSTSPDASSPSPTRSGTARRG